MSNIDKSGFVEGKNLLIDMKQVRLSINKLEQVLLKAQKALNINKEDTLWQQILESSKIQLEALNNRYMDDYQRFCILKQVCISSEWNMLLKKLGYILAETTNIKHIKDCVGDEFELQSAIDNTLSLINHKNVELAQAKQNNYLDDAVIIESSINWLIDDLHKHHWGVQAYNELDGLNKTSQKVA